MDGSILQIKVEEEGSYSHWLFLYSSHSTKRKGKLRELANGKGRFKGWQVLLLLFQGNALIPFNDYKLFCTNNIRRRLIIS